MGVFKIQKMTDKIGVMDSGVGGLTILKELVSNMPSADFMYFGDTKNLPYGTKTKEELLFLNRNILNFFLSKDVKTVVIACNTTSALTYEELKKEFEPKGLKIYPLIQTVVKDAINDLKSDDCICVMATSATVKSGKYKQEIEKVNPKLKVVEIPCSGFVEIVEQRKYDQQESFELIKEKMQIVLENNAKKVILGCTHYPYLVDLLSKFAPKEMFFNPAKTLAKCVAKELNPNGAGNVEFFVTSEPMEFKQSAKLFFDIKNDIQLAIL